jgi:hypothetical protein
MMMPRKVSRLSIRIPWLFEAVAEGPLAITVLSVIASLVVGARIIGWW